MRPRLLLPDAEASPPVLPSRPRAPRSTASLSSEQQAAGVDPVALVLVDVGLPHLDRPFEYLVPASMADLAVPGVRVKVRFAGQDVDGYVLARAETAEHAGKLAPLRKVVSPEAVLTPAVLALSRVIAARYAGTLGDVVRLAVPPRHATAEKNLPLAAPTSASAQGMARAGVPAGAQTGGPAGVQAEAQTGGPEQVQAAAAQAGAHNDPPVGPARGAPEPGPWAHYPAGTAFLRHLYSGDAPAASWLALPGQLGDCDWPAALAVAAATSLVAGRGALVVVPDHRDVERVDAALSGLLGAGQHVRLTAGQGPQARYTAWLKVLRGHVRCVVGTRAAVFAPVHDLGLVAWWDDGDEVLVEQRAPYPHVREVLRARARLEGAALLSGGFTRTTAVQQWVEAGEVRSVCADAATRRLSAPRVVVAGEGTDVERDGMAARAHLPSAAWRAAKSALEEGPVLIQVPRRGYLPSLSCQRCHEPARCARCHGPLALNAVDAGARCRWCGTVAAAFECGSCGGSALRSSVVGARRTAEELGRAFPGVTVHTSGSGEVLTSVSAKPSLVIATPGAEPFAENGYAATLLLDAWAPLGRPTLDASEEALRRWLAAAALTRGASQGGVTVLCGAPMHTTLPPVEALVRWDPAWFAARELAERVGLSLPPTVRMAQLVGGRVAVQRGVELAGLAASVERLGPLPWVPAVPTGSPAGIDGEAAPKIQLLLRVSLEDGPSLTAALTHMKAVRSARKEREPVSVRVDPTDGLG
ncbi:MAG TPA: primosomal protein N' [Dermatophilaceae bacterium]